MEWSYYWQLGSLSNRGGEEETETLIMGNPSDARGQCRIINSLAHKVLLFYWGLMYSEMAPDISGGGGGGRNSAN